MMFKDLKIVIPGAAGLVGQNLIVMLKEQGYRNIVALDQHPANIRILRELHPELHIVQADVAERGPWEETFLGGDVLIMLQAQITSKASAPFIKNNITSTQVVLEAARQADIPFIVHVSSSVVISVADDDYTRTKRKQEELVSSSGFRYCVLRPTLMFGWFDKKHLGWLSRWMAKVPVFPIPGDGKYMRQPLYVRDFCKVIIHCMETQPHGGVYNVTGREQLYYIDIIRTMKRIKKLRTMLMRIPTGLFDFLLRVYALFSSKPPFTPDQLTALTAGDQFPDFDWDQFSIRPTPFEQAMRETHTDSRYSTYVLQP